MEKIRTQFKTLMKKLGRDKRKQLLDELTSLIPEKPKKVSHKSTLSDLTTFKDNKKEIGEVMHILNKNTKDIVNFKQSNKPEIKALYKGKEILKFTKKGKFNKQQVQRIGDQISKSLKNLNGKISIICKYKFGWRSGEFIKMGDKVKVNDIIYDDAEEDDEILEFQVILLEDNKPEGGNNKNNSCLFDCIQSVLLNKNPFLSDLEMKKYLKLPYNSKVDIKYIPKIEDKLKTYSINLMGDHQYISNKKNKTINLLLCDEHYTINNDKSYDKINNRLISYYERKPLIYDSYNFTCYDGEKEFFLTKEEKDKIYKWRTNFILVDKSDKNTSLIDEYNNFINDANILKKETNGVINLYKTGNIKTTALHLFNETTKYLKKPPKIEQLEASIISNASHGAIIFNEKYKGLIHSYDIKSMYPSIMNSNKLFPIDKGEFLTINSNEFNDNFTTYKNYFGLYYCYINKSYTKNDKLFRFNKNNWYSHIDILLAMKLDLSINLIEDNQPNFYYYSRDKLLRGDEIFGNYINLLFDYKERRLPRSKQILNILWGGLCESKTKNYECSKDLKLPKNIEIKSIGNTRNDNHYIGIAQKNKYYISSYARIKPFILGYARSLISSYALPHLDKIVYMHTDSIKSIEKLDIKTGNNIGDLIYEGIKEI